MARHRGTGGPRLALRRETLTALDDGDLVGIAAGTVTGLTFTCITMPPTWVCATERNCITDYCT